MKKDAEQSLYGSILTTPLQDLFTLSDQEKEYIWAAFDSLKLETVIDEKAELNRLQRWCIFEDDPLSYLLTLTVESIHQRWNSSDRFSRFIMLMQRAFESILGVLPDLDLEFRCNDKPFFPLMENSHLQNLLISLVLSNGLRKIDYIYAFREIQSLSEKKIIQERGFTFETIEMIQRLEHCCEVYRELISLVATHRDFDVYKTFNTFISSWLSKFMVSQRNVEIIKKRMAWGYDVSHTLEEIGAKANLTRERVRQVESMFIRKKKFHISEIGLIWIIVESLLNRYGILSLRAVSQKLKEALKWTDQLSIEGLNNLLEHAPQNLFAIVKIEKNVFLCAHKIPCLKCQGVFNCIKENVISNQELSVDSLCSYVVNYCERNCTNMHFELGESFIEWALSGCSVFRDEIIFYDNFIFHFDLWNVKFGKLSLALESYLKNKREAVHFTDICRKLNQLRADNIQFEPRNVHATLERLSNIILWGRGSYIHRQNIKCVNPTLLKEIEDWLIAALHKEGLLFISIFGAFKQFSEQCTAEGICSEPALYSWLKSNENSRLQFPHYPYVDLAIGEYTEGRIALLIEQTVQEAGGKLPLAVLKNFMLQALHIKEHIFSQHLSRTPNILRVKKGYIHRDHINVDERKLSQVIERTVGILEKVPHISVQKIYDETKVICSSMSIDCPELLYSILQIYGDDRLRANRYPKLERIDTNQVAQTGVMKEIRCFIRDKQSFCSYQELTDTFVKKLGYSIQTIDAAIRESNILRYAQGCLVHKDYIGWTPDKQVYLEKIAAEICNINTLSGRFYSEIRDIAESDGLPTLNCDLFWTDTLLSDLLSQSEHFKVLGWRKNIFVKAPNHFGIDSFEHVLEKILEDKFGGAANIDEFEEELIDRDLVKKLTPNIIKASTKLTIVGKEIMLNGASLRA